MKLVIDTRNGIAGDIASAGLIGLGANEYKTIKNMEYAGNYLGKTKIRKLDENNSIKLEIQIDSNKEHLYESKAIEILKKNLIDLKIEKNYKEIAINILNILCEAEKFVHKNYNEAILHEAKDILIDIIGFCTALNDLKIKDVYYLKYVNVGNGKIKFSHGIFDVPAPATEYILYKYNINWKKSNIPFEMATPTGVSILAGSNARKLGTLKNFKIIKSAFAKGTKKLDSIPFYLIKGKSFI